MQLKNYIILSNYDYNDYGTCRDITPYLYDWLDYATMVHDGDYPQMITVYSTNWDLSRYLGPIIFELHKPYNPSNFMDVSYLDLSTLSTCCEMFENHYEVPSWIINGMKNWKLINLTTVEAGFYGVHITSDLAKIISTWDFSKVTNATGLFANAVVDSDALEYLKLLNFTDGFCADDILTDTSSNNLLEYWRQKYTETDFCV